jgi:hypothetical protein
MKRFYMVIDEDNSIAETQFIGLTNPLTRTGRFSHFEENVHWFQNWVLDRMFGPETQRLAAVA